MATDPKTALEAILAEGVKRLSAEPIEFSVQLEKPRRPEHGDYTSTAALQLAKTIGKPPRVIAEELRKITAESIAKSGLSEPLELAGAGFINIRLKKVTKQKVVAQILEQGSKYGRRNE